MHIFFSGIGGTGIGPLALIAKQAGYEVSGSDKQDSQYVEYLKKHGISNIHIGQTKSAIETVNVRKPIDWFVYSSALEKENPNHPELVFCQDNNIKRTKRDELLNEILSQKKLKLIAIAGTHGKTTTTAMVVWLFKKLGLPVSYSVGAKISFGNMGHYDEKSQYFVYECDEFDRNFLAFKPYMTLLSGVTWDHHEIFPTQADYHDAFKQFIRQSDWTLMWHEDFSSMDLHTSERYSVLRESDVPMEEIRLTGRYNRRNAWLALQALQEITLEPTERLLPIISDFPGVSRRFEKIAENLYSDYAHTPEKILGCMSVATEVAAENKQKVVVIYEPLTNRRMHYMKDQHKDIFTGASKIYWVPSYLAREDPKLEILTPKQLIGSLNRKLQNIAEPMELDGFLHKAISEHLANGDLIVCMTGGGGGSLDEWLRKQFGQ